MSIIEVPDALRERLGPEGTKALVNLFNQTARESRDEVMARVQERFARRLSEELQGLRREIAALETRLTERNATTETRLTERIASAETRLIRWSFVFWATLLAALFLNSTA